MNLKPVGLLLHARIVGLEVLLIGVQLPTLGLGV